MMNMNSGYVGWSMSKRAAAAYEDGEMPKSKWTKAAMLAAIAETLDENDVELSDEQTKNLEKLPKDLMFRHYFHWTSWHHTGKYANETSFYGVDERTLLRDVEETSMALAWEFTTTTERSASTETFSTKKEMKAFLKENGYPEEYAVNGKTWYVDGVRFGVWEVVQ